MKRWPRMELDTPIIPEIVAGAIWEEASAWLGEPLPRRWIRELTAYANTIYARNERFRRRVRGQGNRGRDCLRMFMRHWLSAIMHRHRPNLQARMPAGYSAGRDLPERSDRGVYGAATCQQPVTPAANRARQAAETKRRERRAPRVVRRSLNQTSGLRRKATRRPTLWADELHTRLLPIL